MPDGALKAVLVDESEGAGALLKLLNGYARTVATSAEEALARLKEGRVDMMVVSCAARDASLLIPHIKQMPHLLIEWRADGPCCISTSCGKGRSGLPSKEPLPALIAELVEQVRVARGKGGEPATACQAVITVAEDGRIEGVSPAAERIFQYGAEEVVGKETSLLLPLCLPASDIGGQGFETLGTRKDGSRFPMALTIDEMAWGEKRRFVVTLKDLTMRADPLSVVDRHTVRDELTGLCHHNTMPSLLDDALKRADQFGGNVALLVVDIDHLGIVNEMHGRDLGDQVLSATAKMMVAELRDVDRVVRWSGDDMIVILQESTEKKALATAERIRRSVTHLPLAIAAGSERRVPIRLTLSIGAAFYPSDAKSARELLDAAMEALKEAKRRGCDCVVSFGTLGPPPLTTNRPTG